MTDKTDNCILMPTLEQLRREVYEANLGIWRGGLVTMHSGNASGIDRKRGIVMIKPSGMDYDRMRPADMVVTDLEGRKLRGKWNPSVDLPDHLYIYKHCPEVGGVIHTHSNYATSLGLLGKPIPAYLTAIADEFGDEIPCAPYVDNQADHIGQAIVQYQEPSAGDSHGPSWHVCLGADTARGAESGGDARRRRQDRSPGVAARQTYSAASRGSKEVVGSIPHVVRPAGEED